MGKREIDKQRTRARIIEVAERLFVEHGIDSTTTAEIARETGIAHGTVFVHFPTKAAAVSAVFIARLSQSALELETKYRRQGSFAELLEVFLDHIHRHERFFGLYFRELPRFSEELKREIVSFEIAVRDDFHRALSDAQVESRAIAPVLNVLFSQLLYYYSFREVLCGSASVIEVYGETMRQMVLKLVEPGPVSVNRGAGDGS